MKKENVKKSVKKKMTKKQAVTKSTKSCVAKWINLGVLLLGLIAIVVGIFVEQAEIPCKVLGSLAVLGSLVAYSIRSKEHVIVKSILSITFIAILLTWLIPYGAFSEATYYEYGMGRIGLNDIPTLLYYAFYFALDKVVYLLALGGFYGVLSKTRGYQKLVTNIAKKLEKGKSTVVVVSMIIFALITTLLTNTLAVVAFIPFAISVFSKMRLDKLSTFIATFGGILAGLIAAPWGTEGLTWFNYYVGTTISSGFKLRLIISALILLVFIVFAIIHVRKASNVQDKKEIEENICEDRFEVLSLEERANRVPVIILLILAAILVLLGYIDWSGTLEIDIFSKFHTWLTGLTIGEDYTIFAYILGNAAKMFGAWDIATLATVFVILSIVIGLVYRLGLKDFLDAYKAGIEKMLKPIGVYVLVFTAFVAMYMTPIMPTVANWFYNLTDAFNPFITSVVAFIASIFQTDLGYTGYALGSYLTTAFADKLDVVHTIHISMYGLAQLLLPTSGLLVLGLTYTKVEYKTWLKFVWKLAVVLIIILMIVFSIATYV